MVINLKQGFQGGDEYISQASGFIGNPITLSIAIIIVFLLILLFAMLLMHMGTNRWKLFTAGCVFIIITVPIAVAGYEWCRKKSLDEKYTKTKQQFVAPPSQFFGRGPVEKESVKLDSLSDFGDVDDWLVSSQISDA